MDTSEYVCNKWLDFTRRLLWRGTLVLLLVTLSLVYIFNFRNYVPQVVLGADILEPQTDAINDEAQFVVEYPLPVHIPDGQPYQIVASAPGHLWFTLPGANALGNLVVTTTVDFEFTIYDLPSVNSDPHDLVLDAHSGIIWFTQRGVDQIGSLKIETGQITEFVMPTGSSPTGIAMAGNGLLWLTFPGTNQIASFNPTTEIVSTFNPPRTNAGFTGIEVASNGLVWAVAPSDNRLVSFNPSNGVFIYVIVGDFGSIPVAPSGMVMQGNTPWVTVPSKGQLGRYSPGTLNLWFWYVTAPSVGGPTSLAHRTVSSGQEFWYIQPSSNRVGRMLIDSRGRLQAHYLAGLLTDNSQPSGIAVDSHGRAWVTATEANAIVEWRPPYVFKTSLPLILR